MFNLISGALPLTSGDVVFRGESIGGCAPFEIARRGIARTFQHVKLIPRMTRARQRRARRVPARRDRRRCARRCGSTARRRRARAPRRRARSRASASRAQLFDAAGSLPLGKQRIVEIARALAADPLLLLLDEPAAGLRYLEKQELAALLRQLQREGMTMLLVEHDMDFVMGLDRPAGRDGFRREARRRAAGRHPAQPVVLEAYLGGV